MYVYSVLCCGTPRCCPFRHAPNLDLLMPRTQEYFTMEEETLYLAIYLMNLFLKASNTRIPMLQLLCATCLFLACKLEEDSYPEPDLLCSLMENTYDKKAVLKMERRILSALKFELHYSNPLLFLRLLATAGKCSIKSQYLAMYFMELTLLEPEAVTFEPAHLAAAGLYLAQKTMQEAELESFTEIREEPYKLYTCSEDELHPIQHLMAHAALRASASDIKASFLNYSMPPKMCVSTVCTQHLDSLVNRLSSWEDVLLVDGEHDHSANGQRVN